MESLASENSAAVLKLAALAIASLTLARDEVECLAESLPPECSTLKKPGVVHLMPQWLQYYFKLPPDASKEHLRWDKDSAETRPNKLHSAVSSSQYYATLTATDLASSSVLLSPTNYSAEKPMIAISAAALYTSPVTSKRPEAKPVREYLHSKVHLMRDRGECSMETAAADPFISSCVTISLRRTQR